MPKKSSSTPLVWFDDEFNKILGIDVYDYDFPYTLGYLTIRVGSYEVLILRCELADSVKINCISEFLDIDNFQFIQSNITRKKSLGKMYRQFLKMVSLPDDYINEMLDSKYARHFYSVSEILSLRRKWSKAK